jgi:hypothetical protein
LEASTRECLNCKRGVMGFESANFLLRKFKMALGFERLLTTNLEFEVAHNDGQVLADLSKMVDLSHSLV